MRLALKIAYDGTKFHGFAIQPKLRTIQGELITQLTKISPEKNTIKKIKFQAASRTDRGVSAKGNVVAFNIATTIRETLYPLQAKLPDIWIRGVTQTPDKFNPRQAQKRWYRYYLPNTSLDPKKIQQAAQTFQGEHNFTNYAKDKTKNPTLTIDTIALTCQKRFYIIDITARYFLWNQVRRMVAAMEKVGSGKKTVADIKKSLTNPLQEQSFGIAPPENLLLMDISYPNIVFTPFDKPQKRIEDITWYYHMRARMFENISKTPKY